MPPSNHSPKPARYRMTAEERVNRMEGEEEDSDFEITSESAVRRNLGSTNQYIDGRALRHEYIVQIVLIPGWQISLAHPKARQQRKTTKSNRASAPRYAMPLSMMSKSSGRMMKMPERRTMYSRTANHCNASAPRPARGRPEPGLLQQLRNLSWEGGAESRQTRWITSNRR